MQNHPFGIKPFSPYVNSIICGAMLALSFPKPGLSLLAWFVFLPLLYAIRGATPKAAFNYGFIAGAIAYSGIFYWLNIVMTRYGKLPLSISIILTMLMAAYCALYPATICSLVRVAESHNIPAALSLPVLWVSGEFLRAYMLTGFPWALLGYSQYKTLPLIQIADTTGVYGVSFMIVLVNVFLYQLWRWVRGKDGAKAPLLHGAVTLLLLFITVGYGFVSLNRVDSGKEVKVALAQGNIPQDIKWNPAYQEETVAIYERLSRMTKQAPVDLIVWPESSLPFFFQFEKKYADRISALALELATPLIVSSPAVEKKDGRERLLNSAFLIDSSGAAVGRWDKNHLVPFGEYVPMAKMLPFVNKMVQGIGDFAAGESLKAIDSTAGRLGVLVCFEGILPEISRGFVRDGARMLVNITNDAWFGDSSAPYQHLSMTVFRAVENRVPLVRSANTGITAFIDSRGHILGMTRLFREDLLSGHVRLGDRVAFYTRFGDLFAWSCSLLSLALLLYLFAKRGSRGNAL